MSRSYKRTPVVKDNRRGSKAAKRVANKKVRKAPYVANGKAFKKVSCTWDIHDYVSYCSLEEFLNSEWIKYRYPNQEDAIQEWRRCYQMK